MCIGPAGYQPQQPPPSLMDTKPPVHHPGYPVGPPPTASPHIPPNTAPAPPHPSAGTPYMNGGSPLPSNAPPPQCKIEIILYTFTYIEQYQEEVVLRKVGLALKHLMNH